jgi:hypothetical protein
VLAIKDGNNQTGTAGSPLPVSLSVSVKDAFTNPISGVTIDWSVLSGAGSLSSPNSVTDTGGLATIVYTLGNVAGANQVSATVNGQVLLTQTFYATGGAGVGSQFTLVSGDNQSANLGQDLTNPLIVKVLDSLNNPVENATINWTGGTFQFPATLTDANGESQNVLTVGSSGAQTATATQGTLTPLTFHYTGLIPAITDLAGTSDNTSSDLTWTAVSGAGSYNIYTSATPGGPYTLVANSPINSYNATSLTNGTPYYFIVRAVEGANESADSNEISVTPKATWLTQLGLVSGGSPLSDSCEAIAQDSTGNTYCAGGVYGDLGETSGGGRDAFVMKVDPDGAVLWVKQLGATSIVPFGSSAQDDICHGVALDDSGSVYCAGETSSNLGQNNAGGSDAFIAKLSATDGTIQWVQQFGSVTPFGIDKSGMDRCNSLAIFLDNNPANTAGDFLYCAGDTSSPDFGEPLAGVKDAFVLKMNLDGLTSWITQLGATTIGAHANMEDTFTSVAVDGLGNVYCGGHTFGTIADTNVSGSDAFMMKLDSDGLGWYITQMGGTFPGLADSSGNETCDGIAVNGTGDAYCAGSTDGNLVVTNAGNEDAYIIKLKSDGTYDWATQLGDGSGGSVLRDSCLSVTLGSDGSVYCGGQTMGDLGETNAGGADAFVMKLDALGTFQWVSQLGASTVYTGGDNSGDEACKGIITDSSGYIFCAGYTTGAMGETNAATTPSTDSDAFMMKLDLAGKFQ